MSVEKFLGKTYNFLKVIRIIQKQGKSRTYTHFLCKCKCGNIKGVLKSNVINGTTKSCGCFRKKFMKDKMTSHGASEDNRYQTWKNMISRCTHKDNERYIDYGGRGISVCERWLRSPNNFYDDMGVKPSSYHTLERVNNNDGYCKENCVWETREKQSRNRRIRYDNSTGVTGVNLSKKSFNAEWIDINGVKKSKSFSISKYGYEAAFKYATLARDRAIKELNRLGAGYSKTHGLKSYETKTTVVIDKL